MEQQVDSFFTVTPAPGYAAAMCAKCKRILPLAQFKRKLSRAQSMARGYAGSTKLEIESSMCQECQPNKRSISELSAKELTNRAASGDIPTSVAHSTIERRKRKAVNTTREGLQKAWDTVRTAQWHTPIEAARHELIRLRQQEKYAKKTTDLDLTFFVEYKLLLSATIARMRFEKKRSGKEPPFLDWQGYIDEATYAKLFSLWESVPAEYRKRVKPPALFTLLPGDARPSKPVTTLSTMPSPAARLAQGRKG